MRPTAGAREETIKERVGKGGPKGRMRGRESLGIEKIERAGEKCGGRACGREGGKEGGRESE